MKIRKYILAVIITGFPCYPLYANDTTLTAPSVENEKLPETPATKQTDNKSTYKVKKINKGFTTLQRVTLCAAIPVTVGLILIAPFILAHFFGPWMDI